MRYAGWKAVTCIQIPVTSFRPLPSLIILSLSLHSEPKFTIKCIQFWPKPAGKDSLLPYTAWSNVGGGNGLGHECIMLLRTSVFGINRAGYFNMQVLTFPLLFLSLISCHHAAGKCNGILYIQPGHKWKVLCVYVD